MPGILPAVRPCTACAGLLASVPAAVITAVPSAKRREQLKPSWALCVHSNTGAQAADAEPGWPCLRALLAGTMIGHLREPIKLSRTG